MVKGTAIVVEALRKSFPQPNKEADVALNGISFQVKACEIVGLFGPSGCGKSTLLKIISGLLPPDSGEVRINDESVKKYRGKVAYLPQQGPLLPWLDLWGNAMLGWRICRHKYWRTDRRTIEQAGNLFQVFGVTEQLHKFPYECSGGQQQRVALIRALLTPADFMALDEPAVAVDHITRFQIYQTLRQLVEAKSSTIVLASHDAEDLLLFCDRIIIFPKRHATSVVSVPVPFQRPRQSDLRYASDFAEMKKFLWSAMNDT